MILLFRTILCRSACVALLFAPAWSAAACGEASTSAASSPVQAGLADASLDAQRAELLDLAFGAASAFPTNPHAKNRARAEEQVVAACIELGQLARAARYAEQIEGWQRGTCYADLAQKLASSGDVAGAERFLALAQAAAAKERTLAEDESGQEWRRDRILARVAAAQIALGRVEQATTLASGLVEAEAAKLASVRAANASTDEFDAQLRSVDETVAVGNFDLMCAALDACVGLYERFYSDETRRSAAKDKITSSWQKLPVDIRIDFVLRLGAISVEHQDAASAVKLANETQALIDAVHWLPEARIAVAARLASLRHRAGDTTGARADANFALALYDAEQQKIVDIYRAGALRPLAEAFVVLGDPERAAATYTRAIEAGQANPNSRPRAQDFVATCCSMAKNGFRLDAVTLKRLGEIRAGLGNPW